MAAPTRRPLFIREKADALLEGGMASVSLQPHNPHVLVKVFEVEAFPPLACEGPLDILMRDMPSREYVPHLEHAF